MVISLIIATVLYLIILWVVNLLIQTLSAVFDLITFKIIENDIISFIILTLSIIIHLSLGFYLQFYLVTKLCKYFQENYNYITFFLIIPIILGYSLMEKIGLTAVNEIDIKENEIFSNSRDFTKISKRQQELMPRKMRTSFISFVNFFGTIASIILFIIYYFKISIFEKAINYIF